MAEHDPPAATSRPEHRQATASRVRAWALALGFAVLFGSGLLSCLDCLGIADWDSFAAHALVSRRAVVEYGQLPTWNPYHCGGMSIAANFQSRTYTPSFLLVLAFGPVLGLRLWVLLLLALGFEGGRRLALKTGAGTAGSLIVGLMAAGNGHVMMHMASGHLALLTVVLAPLFSIAVRDAWDAPRAGLARAGLWGGLVLSEGGLYPFVYMCLFAALWSGLGALRRRAVTPLLAPALAATGALLVSAATMLPSLIYLLGRGARPVEQMETLPPGALPMLLLGVDQAIDGRMRFAGQAWWWHEYGTYVGPVFLLLVSLGSWRAPRKALPWVLLGGAFLLLSLGDHGPLSPWRLLHHLPVFDSMRVPSRALYFTVLCWGLAGAHALDGVPLRWGGAIVTLLALNLAVVLVPVGFSAFGVPVDLSPHAGPFEQRADLQQGQRLARENRTTKTLDVLHERGDVDCYDPIAPPIAARQQPPGVGEVELLDGEGQPAGRVRTLAWSPSRLVYAVRVPDEPLALVVNQNYDDGWVRTDGAAVRSAGGRLATVVTPGTERVELEYAPLDLYMGLVISLLSLAVCLRELRRPAAPRARSDSASSTLGA